jgi:hypothetical protein
VFNLTLRAFRKGSGGDLLSHTTNVQYHRR